MKPTQLLMLSSVVLTSFGCGLNDSSVTEQGPDSTASGGLSWTEFLTRVAVEPGSGVYIADGDTPLVNLKQLKEFYELNVREGQLIVNRVGSADDRWSDTQKLNLTYCISGSFGSNKAAVVQAMAGATAAWKGVANVQFVYLSAQDANCTASNTNVLFDVNPVNVNGQYIARSFFPSTGRSTRNVLIDNSAFDPTSGVPLIGVLRHELGHTLGFRHEHTRPEAGTCFEDNNWRALTTYDSASVMHYPQCNGTGDWTLTLTTRDAQGAASVYPF